MKKHIIALLTLLTLLIMLTNSCKHELEQPTWDVDVLLPIVNTDMSINDMLTDSNIILSENNEGFISLIFEENFIDINFDTLVNIDAIADEKTHTLDSASFADVVIADTATIGETINEIPFGTVLLPNGSTNDIPAIPNVADEDTINIDASEYFETMTLHNGMLIVEIYNGYPTDISNINLSLINAVNQNTIGAFSFTLIASGTSASDSISIAGQSLDENIFAILHSMDVNASNGPVLINYEDAIITKITVGDIGITTATAIFPEQQLTETLKEHSFDFKNAQIKEIGIKSGTVTIYVLSTLPNGKMIYNIPSLKKNGSPFTSGDMIIPEATSTTMTSFGFDFEGYVLELTGQEGRIGGDTINTIYTEAFTFIDSTGELVTINNTDSFYSYVDFNITPEYAIGYLGEDTIKFGPEIQEINIFKKITADLLDLEVAELKLNVENYIGADFSFKIDNLNTSNAITSVSAGINPSNLYNIDRATLSSNSLPINPTSTEIIINSDEMLEILPNNINAEATFYLNPNGQQNTDGFLYPEYPVNASLAMEIPLSFIAENLELIDTNEVDIPNIDEVEIEKLYIIIENGFPFDADIEVILLDQQDLIIDTLVNNSSISAGVVNNDNKVVQSTTSTIEINNVDLEDVVKIITISSFSTEPVNDFVKIYNDYNLAVSISAKVRKTIGE